MGAITPIQRKLLRVWEAAKVCGISRAHLYNLIRRGELPVVRLGRTALVAVEDLDALIRRHRVGGSPEAH